MTLVVVDPGHGGERAAGSSTPNRAVSPSGLVEKQLALDIALRMLERAPLGVRPLLTRTADVNLSLADRAALARQRRAAVFLSLHFNHSRDPHEHQPWVVVHDRASPSSHALGARLCAELGRGTLGPCRLLQLPVAVLCPEYHFERAACCLVELGFLSHLPTDRRLHGESYREVLAQQLWAGVTRYLTNETLVPSYGQSPPAVAAVSQAPAFPAPLDIYHEVPLVAQRTGMSCWAAAAAMLVGWQRCSALESSAVAAGARRTRELSDGLLPGDVESFARAWGLEAHEVPALSLEFVSASLERCGPLWIGQADPGLHVVVIVGLVGDGTEAGTQVRINDPWPLGLGERYSLPFAEFAQNVRLARQLSGPHVQLLHCPTARRGGARQGPSGVPTQA